MPVYRLHPEYFAFPDPEEAEDGLVAIEGDLNPERLLQAYSRGIFPWYSEDEPIQWWSPDPRCVLFLDQLKISKSMRSFIRKTNYEVTLDTSFADVIENCKQTPRKEQDGTWITEAMKLAYIELYNLGYAHSVEVWDGPNLVGGLYGVSLGNAFFGESMFSKKTNASKLALIALRDKIQEWNFSFIDCQVHNPHLESLGAQEIKREDFLLNLERSLQKPTRKGHWSD